MIKTIALLTRKPGTSHEEFLRRWEHEHAPLAHGVPGLRRYVLSMVRSQPVRADIERHGIEVDGIAELWFDDEAALRAASESPQMQKLRAHGATMIGRIENFVTIEKQIIPRETA